MATSSCNCKCFVTIVAAILCFVVTKHISLQKRFTEEDICNFTTPNEVNVCPENDAELRERSNMMKCGSYPECHGEKLLYHCVKSKKVLVEVCSPKFRVICGHQSGGCCAVFEEGLGRVIIDFNIICPECPSNYFSDKTSKYSTCVETPHLHLYFTTRTVTLEVPDKKSFNQTKRSNVYFTHKNITHFSGNKDPKEYLHIIVPVVIVVVLFLSAIPSIGIYVYCNHRKKNSEDDKQWITLLHRT